MEPIECFSIIRGYKKRLEFNNYSNYISTLNAIGAMFAKKYKYKDIFKEKKDRKITKEEKDDLFNELDKL